MQISFQEKAISGNFRIRDEQAEKMLFVPWQYIADWKCNACGQCCGAYSVVVNFHEWLKIVKNYTYTLNSLSNILGIALGFIPPVYYPEEMLGGFSWISAIFPTSNAASLIRVYSGSLNLPFEMVIARWLILIVTMVVSAVITAFKARWREP